MSVLCEHMIENYSLEPFFIQVAWHIENIEYSEPYFGEENTMFTGYTYGKPSFGKKNYLQFLKEMDIETTVAAYECFSENINKNDAAKQYEFVEKWRKHFHKNIHHQVNNPDFVGKEPISEIHCKVTSPFTKETRTCVFTVAKGVTVTSGLVLYANTIAHQDFDRERNETTKTKEGEKTLADFRYNGSSIVKYFHNPSEVYGKTHELIVRCEFDLEPVK